jgi:hypothetical protein
MNLLEGNNTNPFLKMQGLINYCLLLVLEKILFYPTARGIKRMALHAVI